MFQNACPLQRGFSYFIKLLACEDLWFMGFYFVALRSVSQDITSIDEAFEMPVKLGNDEYFWGLQPDYNVKNYIACNICSTHVIWIPYEIQIIRCPSWWRLWCHLLPLLLLENRVWEAVCLLCFQDWNCRIAYKNNITRWYFVCRSLWRHAERNAR